MRRPAPPPRLLPFPARPRRGFTLVEAIATICILATLGSVASSLVLSAATSWRDAAVTAQLHDELSTALERIAKEVRGIRPDAGAPDPAPMISSLTPTSLAYNAASSLTLADGRLDFVDAGAAPVPLLRDLSNVTLRAYGDAGELLPSTLAGDACRAIRRIEISLILQRRGVSHTLRTRLFLRSTMSGAGP